MAEPTANKRVFDRTVTHGIFLQRYKSSVVKDITSYLDEEVWPKVMERIESEIQSLSPTRSRQLFNLRDITQALIEGGLFEAARRTRLELEDFSVTEAEWQVAVLRQAIPVKIDLSTPPPQILKALVSETPFQGEILGDWFKSLSQTTQERLVQEIRLGVVGGTGPKEIVKRLLGTKSLNYADGVLQTTRRNVESIVRTAVANTMSAARDETLEANTTVIKGVQWVSVLDSRTTLICQSRDGKVYALKNGPRPPAHWNCRSTVVPVVKSWRELGINLDEAPEGTRASLNGQIAERVSYGEWLASQSEFVQDHALGKRRADLFRGGKVKINRFVDSKGRTLRLSELRELEGLSR